SAVSGDPLLRRGHAIARCTERGAVRERNRSCASDHSIRELLLHRSIRASVRNAKRARGRIADAATEILVRRGFETAVRPVAVISFRIGIAGRAYAHWLSIRTCVAGNLVGRAIRRSSAAVMQVVVGPIVMC